jgi:hypothetical protein
MLKPFEWQDKPVLKKKNLPSLFDFIERGRFDAKE